MKRISKLIAVSLTAAAIICSMASGADCYSAIGSRGTEVRNIQQRLKDWGYYSGSVDGIYGTATKAAVIKFQKKHKITADGICGKKTLELIGLPTGSASSGSSTGAFNRFATDSRIRTLA